MAKRGQRLVTRYSDKLDLSLTEFKWDARTARCIRRGRLRTVRDVVTRSEAQLGLIKGVGRTTLQRFREFAEGIGYVLEKGRAAAAPGPPVLIAVNLEPVEAAEISAVTWRFVRHQLRRDDDGRVRFPSRSEVVRAGLVALAGMPADDLERVFADVPERKRGRPAAGVAAEEQPPDAEEQAFAGEAAAEGMPFEGVPFEEMVRRFERRLITETLRRTDYNAVPAARVLQMKESTLRRKIREMGIERPADSLSASKVRTGPRAAHPTLHQQAEEGALR
jgi:Arc/MetJ-type ribon-helix-helix transcriptional regulator